MSPNNMSIHNGAATHTSKHMQCFQILSISYICIDMYTHIYIHIYIYILIYLVMVTLGSCRYHNTAHAYKFECDFGLQSYARMMLENLIHSSSSYTSVHIYSMWGIPSTFIVNYYKSTRDYLVLL